MVSTGARDLILMAEGCLFFFFLMFIIFERETEREQGRGREGDTESEAASRLRAVSTEPDVRLELTNCEIMA